MFEGYPLRHSTSTWADCVLQGATVAVGVLIALGLEQTVEWGHRRERVTEVRRELSAELESNRRYLAANLASVERLQPQLARDMAVLVEHRGGRQALTTKLDYDWDFLSTPDGAWLAARENGSLGLLPTAELERYANLYYVYALLLQTGSACAMEMEIAKSIANRTADGALSAKDTEDLISATSDAQGKLDLTVKMLKFEQVGIEDIDEHQ